MLNDVRPQGHSVSLKDAVLPRDRALRSAGMVVGFDEYAGRDYSHRKEWVLERLTQLSHVFAIDDSHGCEKCRRCKEQEPAICTYAIMSNHYHLVVHVDAELANRWSPQEVVERWCRMFSKPALIDRWQQGMCGDVEREVAECIIELWRGRLCDVSWYMRSLNEHLARRANAEDRCTGRFWAGSSLHAPPAFATSM